MRSVNGKRTQWMDKALEDQPAERKARVLEIILKYGIDPEDEFFIIFVALGQLQVLIEESPQSWQTLFADFESALDAWSNNHLNSLEALAANAENSKEHAEGLKKLKKILSIYGKILEQLRKDIRSLSQNYKSLNNPQNDSYRTWEKTLNDTLDRIESRIEGDRRERQRGITHNSQGSPKISSDKKVALLMFLSIAGFSTLGFFQWQQHQMIEQIQQRSEWIWINQLKRDCQSGARSPESSECTDLL